MAGAPVFFGFGAFGAEARRRALPRSPVRHLQSGRVLLSIARRSRVRGLAGAGLRWLLSDCIYSLAPLHRPRFEGLFHYIMIDSDYDYEILTPLRGESQGAAKRSRRFLSAKPQPAAYADVHGLDAFFLEIF